MRPVVQTKRYVLLWHELNLVQYISLRFEPKNDCQIKKDLKRWKYVVGLWLGAPSSSPRQGFDVHHPSWRHRIPSVRPQRDSLPDLRRCPPQHRSDSLHLRQAWNCAGRKDRSRRYVFPLFCCNLRFKIAFIKLGCILISLTMFIKDNSS